jgi:hypothetical protein
LNCSPSQQHEHFFDNFCNEEPHSRAEVIALCCAQQNIIEDGKVRWQVMKKFDHDEENEDGCVVGAEPSLLTLTVLFNFEVCFEFNGFFLNFSILCLF